MATGETMKPPLVVRISSGRQVMGRVTGHWLAYLQLSCHISITLASKGGHPNDASTNVCSISRGKNSGMKYPYLAENREMAVE